MELGLFSNQDKNSTSHNFSVKAIDDAVRVQQINEKLYTKRKALEETLQTCDENLKIETMTELALLKESMKTFGISETDYQIYLAKTEEILH